MPRTSGFCQMTEITNYLFLSGVAAISPEKLKSKRITCIINATIEQPNIYIPGVDCMKVAIEDSIAARIDQYFDMVADRIRSVKERGEKVLVHCVAGVSRSASLCIIYLVKHEKMSLRQAYYCIKAVRPVIKPNIGFWQQMVDFERKLRGASSVDMVRLSDRDVVVPDVYCSELKKKSLSLFRPPRPQYISSPASALKFGSLRKYGGRNSQGPSYGAKRPLERHYNYSGLTPTASVFPLMNHFPPAALISPSLSPAPTRRIGTSRLFAGLSLSGFREL